MSSNPSAAPSPAEPAGCRERIRTRALELLAQHRASPVPGGEDAASRDAALATGLMDTFRATADREVFECLVQWVGPQLHARIRSRLRGLGGAFDAHEILQDTIVNIYRYPDRFLASRPGAFAAWSSTIVDNAIRRLLRRRRQALDVAFRAPELLHDHADPGAREPSLAAQDHEECSATAQAFALLLQGYLAAFRTLSEREQFVLQMVEVRGMRYAELAGVLAIRPEALKMIVFRARKRLLDRTTGLLAAPVARGPAAACVLASA
jgi:RNA polymerase sigma-70 factor (ECF subfamily)